MRRAPVNFIASSPLCPSRVRMSVLRRYGLDVQAASVADRCFFGGSDIVLGPGSVIGRRCIFDNTARVTIGRGAVLGSRVLIATSTHEIGPATRRSGKRVSAPVTVGERCRIGGAVTIMAGATIGEGCVVRAGSLVRGSLEPYGEYAGVPARRIRDLRDPVASAL